MALTPLEEKITITYNKGQNNVVADALSRAPLPPRCDDESEAQLSFTAREYERLACSDLAHAADLVVRSVTSVTLHSDELDSWAAAYADDPRWRRIWKRALTRYQSLPAAAMASSSVGTESETHAPAESGPAAEGTYRVTEDGNDLLSGDGVEERPEDLSVHRAQNMPDATQQVPTRTLRPRTIMAVHRSDDEDLYFVRKGLLFVRIKEDIRICVPMSKLDTLIHEYHTSIRSGHPSVERTVTAMNDHVFAHDLAKQVAAHVRVCYECQVNKAHRHKAYGDMQPIVTPHEVFDTLAMDFITGLPRTERGFDSILVVADKYTRFALFLPNHTTDTAEKVASLFLERVFPVTGLPKSIISDRDVKFTSKFWSTLMASLDVKLRMSTAYHPQTDGLVERLNGQLETMLRHYVAIDQHDWDSKLPALSMAYNNQKQESTTQSPYLMVFGREPVLFPLKTLTASADPAGVKVKDLFAIHADARVEMELAQERQRRAYNSRHQPMEFATGDYVLVDLKNYRLRLDPTEQARSKLAPRYAGPFPVKSRVGRLAYELDVPPWFKAHPVMPITALEPFKGDPSTSTPRPQAGIAAEGGANELRVDSFVGRRPSILEGGKHFDYLVKWLGSPPSWQSDNRLPLLGWAKEAFEKRARAELGIKRLRHHSTIILPEATALALELEEADSLSA
ncbi:hypothetical protein A4X06_0g9228 [Tilletia controversa]|uniref:Integrase catalytic domain-containing protein n=1 Tax=Tilletia controversa TaxID=13291 RepID=A0A8X7SSF7_9BASI|nr:hypothetical protein A4X06_0g9228 [Tilletia controversa]